MTKEEQELEIAAGEYGSAKRASYGYPTYICLVDAFLAGAKYQQEHSQLQMYYDMLYMENRALKEQLKEAKQ